MINFDELLKQQSAAIIDKWYKKIIDSYPVDSTKFFLGNKDPFANPIGHLLKTELPLLYHEMFQPAAQEELLAERLDNIIKVRAVQDFSPSEAIHFLIDLKHIVCAEIKKLLEKPDQFKAFRDLENRFDNMLLLAFDIYMKRREKIFAIKAEERRRTFGAMVDKINRKYGTEDDN